MKRPNNKLVALLLIAVIAVPVTVAFSAQVSRGADEFVSYYDQLDANGKAIYDAIGSADADTTAITVKLPFALTAQSDDPEEAKAYLRGLVKSTTDTAFTALRLSSPLAYWTWGPSHVTPLTDLDLKSGIATITTLFFTISFVNYPKDPVTGEFQGIEKMLDDLNAAIDKFHTDSESIRGKVLDINNYLVNLVTYDPSWREAEESRYTHDVYGVFVDPRHFAVCDGYSKAFLVLCEKEGIESVVVMGTALPNLENHAWNYVKMDDGKWYAIDVTWNDNGRDDNPYFLNGGDTFFFTHHQSVFLRSGLLAYRLNAPAISETAYDAEEETDYELYSWILAAIIVAAMSVALYRYAKRGG